MKLLLINPPLFLKEEERSAIERVRNSNWPIGLAYLASIVRELDLDIKILDANLYDMSKNEIERSIHDYNPDVVGITATTAAIRSASIIAHSAKMADRDTLTIVGGPHMTADPYNTMKAFPQIDIGVVGDGEEIFKNIIETLIQGRKVKGISGIIYRGDDGKIVQNPPPQLGSLDEIPFPSWDLLPPLKEYSFQPSTYKKHPHTYVTASRGCPYRCIFCHVSKFRPNIRYRSPENVVGEIEILIGQYGVKEIRFADELFTLNRKWVGEICGLIHERGLDFPWSCDARANHMTSELAHTLSGAGCWQISMGIESGSPKILERIKKDITIEQVRGAVKYAHAANMTVRAYFMLGFPFETREDIEATIQFAKDSNVDYAQFSYVTPFPGTELYDMCLKRGDFRDPGWLEYNASVFHEPVISPESISREELKIYLKRAYKEFYLRPALWYRLMKDVHSLEDIKRYMHGISALARI